LGRIPGPLVRILTLIYRAAIDASYRFDADDGWAIASHIALSALMALFPFLIVVTALAAVVGSQGLADEVARILFEAWPTEVAEPLAGAVHDVVVGSGSGTVTLGVVLAVFFASSGIESLRIGLNRAYGMVETRNWLILRLESIGYVIVAALALLALAFFIVLGPLIFATALKHATWLGPLENTVTFARFGIASIVLVSSLVIVHKWLPAGRRRISEIGPGILVTLALWLLAGTIFGRYLAEFAYTYVTYYAGLASAMIALVFLYYTSMIFVYGGEFNTAFKKLREPTPPEEMPAP
jgi:membrane protein